MIPCKSCNYKDTIITHTGCSYKCKLNNTFTTSTIFFDKAYTKLYNKLTDRKICNLRTLSVRDNGFII